MCEHYHRFCLLEAPCCDKLVPCRHCHNASSNHGQMDRYAVKRMKCKLCDLVQPVQQFCAGCHQSMAKYYCDICHLFEERDIPIYHCVGCHCCRIGHRDEYLHCEKCNLCLPKDGFSEHLCLENRGMSNCPLCLECVFWSREPIQLLKCGHVLHESCAKALFEHSFKCPVCQQSMCDMGEVWMTLRSERDATPMPEDLLHRQCKILCNDCHRISDVKFHIVGLECPFCGSFNTRQR